jgi:hypothetical protein
MKIEVTLAAPCGLYCGECENLGDKCQGCMQVKGKPFWTALYKVDVYPLYDCSINKKHLEHCGLCADFPCKLFLSLRDPSQSDEEADKSVKKKQADLKTRKKIGTEAWIKSRK